MNVYRPSHALNPPPPCPPPYHRLYASSRKISLMWQQDNMRVNTVYASARKINVESNIMSLNDTMQKCEVMIHQARPGELNLPSD